MKEKKLHPRPIFERENWLDLCGEWDFDFDDDNIGEKEHWYKVHNFSKKINVPFVFESEQSGIGSKEIHSIVWYKKIFEVPKEFKNKSLILNIGAIDYKSKIYVNGFFVSEHIGGYSSFNINISEYINSDEENTICIRVEDDAFDKNQPRGKQMWKSEPFGCWYTGYTGIWQSIWIEIVEALYIDYIKLTPNVSERKIEVFVDLNRKNISAKIFAKIKFKDKVISEVFFGGNKSEFSFDINIENDEFEWNGLALWDVNSPNLYDIEFILYKNDEVYDKIYSYFGMRSIEIREDRILLNNIVLYQKLLLYQGYYKKGLITHFDDQEIIDDIENIKKMGFNGIRIHEKIESSRFLYWCDKLGLLVWEEMPSAYNFNETMMKNITHEWQEIIKRDYNHPCIITWVTFNESWGVLNLLFDKKQQNLVKSMYNLTKAYDLSRPVIGNDGWEHTFTDICTIHDYVKTGDELSKVYTQKEKAVSDIPAKLFPRYTFAQGYNYSNQPVIISEFGGISFETDNGWGYNDKVKDSKTFLERLASLINAISELDYVNGYCLTQYTDVEHEQNGLLTIEREFKVDFEEIRKIVTGENVK